MDAGHTPWSHETHSHVVRCRLDSRQAQIGIGWDMPKVLASAILRMSPHPLVRVWSSGFFKGAFAASCFLWCTSLRHVPRGSVIEKHALLSCLRTSLSLNFAAGSVIEDAQFDCRSPSRVVCLVGCLSGWTVACLPVLQSAWLSLCFDAPAIS